MQKETKKKSSGSKVSYLDELLLAWWDAYEDTWEKALDAAPLVVEEYKQSYDNTQNPFYLIRAFCFCHKFKIEIPQWVLNPIADIFQTYLDSKNKMSLDKAFGLMRGKGRKPAYMAIGDINNEYFINYDIHKLRRLFNLKLAEAVKMVVELWRKENKHQDFYISDSKLIDQYTRHHWAKKLDNDPLWKMHFTGLNNEHSKKEFIQKLSTAFPSIIPAKIKKSYNIK